MRFVLDSSATLAILWNEVGSEYVLERVDGAVMSAVNYAEVMTKIADRGVDRKRATALLARLAIEIVSFDQSQAEIVGQLRSKTKSFGLSLGDRACIALAQIKGWPALTADKVWTQLEIDVEIELLR